MFSTFFINRPIFAAVISVVITLVGLISLFTLPIDQYPYINPPTVKISTSFPGAAANTAAESVTTPIEQELNGVPDMLYMRSSSSKTGGVGITITFDVGTDQDLAAVNVQNNAKQADSSLPVDVMQEGVSVDKEASIELLKLALTSNEAKYDDVYLSNFLSINVADAVRRIPGVGRTRNTGARSYSMRIWLRPDRMASHGLTTSDVSNAIKEQNKEAAAGTLGAQPNDVAMAYPITTQGRLTSASEFGNVIVRANPDGSMIRLRDIARIELASSAYTLESKLNGSDAAILQVYLLPGANALEVAAQVKETMQQLSHSFPKGVDWTVWYDSSTFIEAAITEVISTLIEALIIVIFVVFLFLQNWRATLIPALAVPVSIVGTFAVMAVLGFTLNTVNLLALVLAIGIVVDDAIVVVENVERLMKEEKINAAQATKKAMIELSGALVATSLVLAAVFVPVSFLAGITGIMYREFAISITVAVLISTIVALTLSPALCAILLKKQPDHKGKLAQLFDNFNLLLERSGNQYTRYVGVVLQKQKRAFLAFILIIIGASMLFKYMPSSFMPQEDQGRFFVDMELADGSSVSRSKAIVDRASEVLRLHPAVKNVFSLAGESKRSGGNEGAGTLEVVLNDWSSRQADNYTVQRVIDDVYPQLQSFVEVTVRAYQPPAIAGLGSGSGVEMELQNKTGTNAKGLKAVADQLIAAVEGHPAVAEISTSLKPEIPLLELEVDRAQAKALGIPIADIYSAMRVYTGSSSINDFNMFGRVYRVKMQADAEFRDRADALNHYYVRSSSGVMVPLNVVAKLKYTTGPASIVRYNMFNSASISATPARGYATGDVVKVIEQAAQKVLPPGYGYEWTGMTFQEIRSAGQTTIALSLAFVFVYLFLAALYESWTVPLAVLLIVPVAMLGAVSFTYLRGMENNLFFQIAFIALIGLSAKNSILIVEFCQQLFQQGMKPIDAALKAAQLRFRPIMMTAVSFILGVLPLVLSSGPGAVSRMSMATPILGGMLLATTVGIILVPLFFVTLANLTDKRSEKEPDASQPQGDAVLQQEVQGE